MKLLHRTLLLYSYTLILSLSLSLSLCVCGGTIERMKRWFCTVEASAAGCVLQWVDRWKERMERKKAQNHIFFKKKLSFFLFSFSFPAEKGKKNEQLDFPNYLIIRVPRRRELQSLSQSKHFHLQGSSSRKERKKERKAKGVSRDLPLAHVVSWRENEKGAGKEDRWVSRVTHFCCTIFCEKNFVPLLYFCRARPFLRLRDTMDYTNQKLLSYLRKGGKKRKRVSSSLFFETCWARRKKALKTKKNSAVRRTCSFVFSSWRRQENSSVCLRLFDVSRDQVPVTNGCILFSMTERKRKRRKKKS